ncbi:MAG TPA: acylphosphatase [Acidimicrobiales bacterium]|nr:acylphosphatase [Acidimicrobiales bacterium]
MTAPEPGTRVARRVVVDGRVQGVGFRQSCADTARRLHLGGWVRNRTDGRVEAVFEGPAAAVGQMVAWCRRGPQLADVTEVRVEEQAPAGLLGFRVAGTASDG